jgi:hypothetical protein
VNVFREREVADKPIVANTKMALECSSKNAGCRDVCWFELEIDNDDCSDRLHTITVLRCKRKIYCLLLSIIRMIEFLYNRYS